MLQSVTQPPRRSTKGCWTCRIRHRKCDESVPTCTECTHRHIQCHGYGAKPAWADDPLKHSRELQRIKRNVKANFCRNVRLRTTKAACTGLRVPFLPVDPDLRVSSLSSLDHDEPLVSLPSSGTVVSFDSTLQSTLREAQLLVHYLDYIFPIQYPYYVDRPDLGGRGWLFWLLTRKGPLREAALTLSALHKHTGSSRGGTESTEEELLRHHTNAMKELRQALRRYEVNGSAGNREQWVELISCGTSLVSFEVFQGGIGNWAPHLDALSAIICQVNPVDFDTDLAEQAGTADIKSLRSTTPAWRFLVCNLLWFDLLACASTGQPPRLPYREWLDLEGMDISCVMGCQNWAMIAIGDIATLRAKLDVLDSEEIRSQVEAIAARLWDNMDSLTSDCERRLQPISHYLTRVFAAATLIQLQIIAPDMHCFTSDIRQSVERAIRAIEDVPEGVSLRGLTWPICIAGSMAQRDQQPFFENLMEAIIGESGFQYTNCGTVLRILRHCWSNFDSDCSSGSDEIWGQAMAEMGICALLV